MSLAPPRPRLPPHTAVRAFEAAARHGSFARAAEELFVTPAAVAQQIKALETWAGGALFERHSQGIRLSAHGRRALPALSAAVDQLGLAVQALRQETQTAARRSTLQVAALPAMAQLWLSPRLSRLKAALPGVQVSVTALEQPPNFRREPFDLGLFYARGAEAAVGATGIPLARDRLVPVCSPRVRASLESARPRPLDDLLDVLARCGGLHDTVWRDDWSRWLQAVRPGTTAAEADALAAGPDFSLYSLALQAALDGEGVLMGRERLVAPLLEKGRLHAPWGRPKALSDTLMLLVPAHRKGPLLAQQVQALQALVD
ncbi:Glycine cleavage system transcriptional activator [compost metagenome]